MATNNAVNIATAATGKVLRAQGVGVAPLFSTATYPDTAGTSGNVLTSNGTNWDSTAPAARTKTTTFLVDGSWTIDPRAIAVEFFVWGGGGGGGSGRCGASGAAGGGAGGAAGNMVYQKTDATKLTSSPYTITIGTGGTGGISLNAVTTNGNPGGVGLATTIGSIITTGPTGAAPGGVTGAATGGNGVFYNQYNFAVISPSGSGSATLATAPTAFIYGFATAGGGGSGYTAVTPRVGAAGGAITDPAGGTLVAGGLAGANTGATAGNGNTPGSLQLLMGGTGGGGGGHDGSLTAGTGGNGAQPGAGGGGGAGTLSSNPSGAGGNGGNGKVIIIEYF